MVISIQTFGSYANFHPHLHALVTNGVMTCDCQFLNLPHWTPRVMEELFRRLALKRLVAAERLSGEFQETLLGSSALGVRGARRAGGLAR